MTKKQYVHVIDLDRCIGCKGGCQVACKSENNVALGESRSKLYTMGPTGTYPELEMYFIPVMCQQCEAPSCASVCPTGACYKSNQDGVINIDTSLCMDCQSCKRACPYDVPFENKELRVMDKCDACHEKLDAGERPPCVKNCAGKAIYCGDMNDPDSEVSCLLKEAGEENVYSLPDKGNKPISKFVLRNANWIDAIPHEFTAGGRTDKNGK